MSFDLYLRGDNLGLAAIFSHLDQHPGFQRQQISGPDFGCAYVNQATGVYCYLDIHEHHPNDGYVKSLAFSLNYNRPAFFALETMPLVESLCRQFQLLVEDPQEEFVGPASLPDLINSWKIHNERAVKALKADGMPLNYMPESKANEWWAYTRVREQLAEKLGDSVFVPEVFILKRPSEEPFRMIVCPVGTRQLLPASDVVCIDRSDEQAGTTDLGFVSSERFLDLVAPYTTEYRLGHESYMLLDPVSHPEVIAKTRQLELTPLDTQHEAVAPDGFHNVVLDE
jgi:hypothetical protein